MGVSPEKYKDALSRFPSGITVVTTASAGRLHGMTASSFASVSLRPPLILVVLDLTSQTRSLVLEAGTFAVNVLSEHQEEISRTFARREDKGFEDLAHGFGTTGAPLLEGAIAWIECRVERVVDGGDHQIVVGEVVATKTAPGKPLVYYERDYRRMDDSANR